MIAYSSRRRGTFASRRESGVSVVEFIILLPFFLVVVLFFLWFGVTMNARTSLASAVTNGVRLAATRGRGDIYNNFQGTRLMGSIPEIDASHDYIEPDGSQNPAGPVSGRLQKLMTADPEPGDPYEKYNESAADTYGTGIGIFDIPAPEQSYAIMYAVQSMRMSMGENLRYPCDPRGADSDGCLFCRIVNPETLSDEPYTGEGSIVRKRIAIRCDYKPTAFILGPLLRALNAASGGAFASPGGFGVISFAEKSDWYEGCDLQEVPDASSPTGFRNELCCPGVPCA